MQIIYHLFPVFFFFLCIDKFFSVSLLIVLLVLIKWKAVQTPLKREEKGQKVQEVETLMPINGHV